MTDSHSPRRCAWTGDDPLMCAYHDTEWGVPQRDPRALWEMLVLESFQAGLSWSIVLRKREALREAFAGFDPARVARFPERTILRLLQNDRIIRSRAKIEAARGAARIYCEMAGRGENFAEFCWSFTEGRTIRGNGRTFPVMSPLSERMSRTLKDRGFKFCGPTIVYAWMQAVGIVNDHAAGCFRRDAIR